MCARLKVFLSVSYLPSETCNVSTIVVILSTTELAEVSEVQCIVYAAFYNGPLMSTFMIPSQPQEAAKEAVLVLQSIFWGSEGVKVTPSPARNAIQESKQEKPRMDCTYCTGKSGLNLETEETETEIRTKT